MIRYSRVSSTIKSLGGRFTHAAKCLTTPTFVDHTPYYMLVHRSRNIAHHRQHIIDSTNVMMSLLYKHFGGEGSPQPPH